MSMTIGIDPHKASHTAVAIDGDEHPVARLTVTADRCQYISAARYGVDGRAGRRTERPIQSGTTESFWCAFCNRRPRTERRLCVRARGTASHRVRERRSTATWHSDESGQ